MAPYSPGKFLEKEGTMAREKKLIDNKSVDELTAGNRIYDTKQVGFYVDAGKKFVRFGVMYDFPHALRKLRDLPKTCEIGIGRYPEWSPKDARDKAAKLVGQIKEGIHPGRDTLA